MKKTVELCDICQDSKIDTVADGHCVGCGKALCKQHSIPITIQLMLYSNRGQGKPPKVIVCNKCRHLLLAIRDNRGHKFRRKLHSGLRVVVGNILREALEYGKIDRFH